MKKNFMLLSFSLFLALSSFAQWGGGRNDRHDRSQHDQYRIYNFRTEDDLLRDMNLNRSQERRIDRINDQSRQKMYRIQNDRFGSSQHKRWQIERVQQERRRDIMNILSGFQRDRYNAWCARDDNRRDTYGSNGRYGKW